MEERRSKFCFLCNPPTGGPLQPSARLTAHQLLYVLVIHGLGAMAISGGINFAIATGMYRHSSHAVRLWNINDNSLAGDAAVTLFVQTIVTWLISALLVCNDVRTRALGIQPLLAPKALSNRFAAWYLSTEGMDLLEPKICILTRLKRIIGGVIRALFLSVPFFFLWWPIGVGVMAGVGKPVGSNEYAYNHYPEPQLFKLIYGATLGLFITPVIALAALMAKGRQATFAST